MKSLFMEELSWAEIQEAMDCGADTVLICAGSQEQHGPHLAESTDCIIGRALCGFVAQRIGNTLVAPLIRPGLSAHHMNHPGSLTLRPEVFRGLVEDYVDCYIKHGFRTVILISSHGGNFTALAQLAEELAPRYPGAHIISPLTLGDYIDVCAQADQMYSFEEGACGGHACRFETSIVLWLEPNCVDMSRAVRGYVDADRDGVGDKLFAQGMMKLSPCGILGDATGSSPELGKVFLELLVDKVCQVIQRQLSFQG